MNARTKVNSAAGAPQKPPVVLLVGPTAVGKTEMAIQVARDMGAEIVSADSRLFYRGMDVGTAKPTHAQRARIAHHLIDIAEPDETVSLAVFQRLARAAIADIHRRGLIPLLVGGTGQYVRAVTAAWAPPPIAPDGRLRDELQRLQQERGGEWLHHRLDRLDPEAAKAIDPRNVRRTMRALEVILTSGRKFSLQRTAGAAPYQNVTIGLKRSRVDLYARIDLRIDAMLASGLLEETQHLLGRGYAADLPSMSAIGYRECVQVIRGQMDLEGARKEMRRRTRIFVRHQANWFKESDPEIAWFDAAGAGVLAAVESHIWSSLH